MRRHLNAAKYGRLYENRSGVFIRAVTAGAESSRRAQLRLVEQALAEGLLVRGDDGVYRLTTAGEARI